MKKRELVKPRFNFTHEIIDIPTGRRHQKTALYEEVIDKLLTLDSHQAMKLNWKDFVGKAESLPPALYIAAKKKKVAVSVMLNDEHVTVWRKVSV